jgi:DNA invertase Pin-like site-specific DNA recombinase
MMMLGYARVSTSEQDTASQVSALKSAGCEKIFREKASGGRWDRPELIRLLDQLHSCPKDFRGFEVNLASARHGRGVILSEPRFA